MKQLTMLRHRPRRPLPDREIIITEFRDGLFTGRIMTVQAPTVHKGMQAMLEYAREKYDKNAIMSPSTFAVYPNGVCGGLVWIGAVEAKRQEPPPAPTDNLPLEDSAGVSG